MTSIIIALTVWLAGVGTTGQANTEWQEYRDGVLPEVCTIFEDGSGDCKFSFGTLRFPAWPENNGEQGIELPTFEPRFNYYQGRR